MQLETAIGAEVEVGDHKIVFDCVQLTIEVGRQLLTGVGVGQQSIRNLEERKGTYSGPHLLYLVELRNTVNTLTKVLDNEIQFSRL